MKEVRDGKRRRRKEFGRRKREGLPMKGAWN
jgi:hypothetical protein